MNLPPYLTSVTPLSKTLAIILFILLPIVGFALGMEYQKMQYSTLVETTIEAPDSTQSNTIPKATSAPTSTPNPSSKIPGWLTQTSFGCGAIFHFPPKNENYSDEMKGEHWIFEEYSGGREFDGEHISQYTARTIYKHPDAASGQVTADVEVDCFPNAQSLTSEQWYEKQVAYWKNIDMQPVRMRNEILWNKNVIVFTITGGFDNEEYYLFASNTNMYLIRKFANAIHKETVNTIFNNIQFSD